MPLLKREIDIFPPNLFASGVVDRPWWVGHTRSRQEKAFARHLRPFQIPFYLPLSENALEGDRRRSSFLPLFPGYVFFRATPAERREALRSHLLVRVLEVEDQALLEGELMQLHELVRQGARLTPLRQFAPGDLVRVVRGPFQGYDGVVVRESRPRCIVAITMLRQAVAVEFDEGSLVPDVRRSGAGNPRVAVA
jgi:transcription antitermination factor NusG